jgi:hypothetical protein
LLISDYDVVNGTLRACKARVAGIDKNCTKTGEDRIVTLCPRAIRILAGQLKLRARLKTAGLIDHDHLFFTAEAERFVTCRVSLTDGGNRFRVCPTFGIAARTTRVIHP